MPEATPYVGRRRAAPDSEPAPGASSPSSVPPPPPAPLQPLRPAEQADPDSILESMAAPAPLTRVGARQARSAQSGRSSRSARPGQSGRPAKVAKPARPPRSTTLAGATVPATAAAALSLVATGVGVAAGLDGAAVAQSQTTEPDASAALALATVRDVGAAPRDVALAVAERHQQAVLQASRNQARAELAQAALLKTQAAHRWVLPVARTSRPPASAMRWGKLHAGEDFAAPIGTPVHAISSGVVVFAGVEQGYGNKIEIRHWDGTCSWYGHLSKIDVKVGQKVDPGGADRAGRQHRPLDRTAPAPGDPPARRRPGRPAALAARPRPQAVADPHFGSRRQNRRVISSSCWVSSSS